MISDLKIKYKQLDSVGKLIAINVAVFVVLRLISFFFQSSFLYSVTTLPSSFNDMLLQPWTLLSYAFVHRDFWHLAMNMLMLFYVSRLLLAGFTSKQLLTVYFLGAWSGAILFLISFNVFPVFTGHHGVLLGASASVMALLLFTTVYSPNKEVYLFGAVKLKLWHLTIAFVVLDLIQIPKGNAGGHIAHLGGAILGYVYASQLKKGNNIGIGFERIMDAVSSWFKPKPTRLKTVHKTRIERKATHKTIYQKQRVKQEQIDAILDKISKSGYDSLSKNEKEFLFKAGKE